MFKGKFFKISYGIILILIIIFLTGQIPYVMKPLSKVLSLVLLPLLLGGFLYYLLRPIMRFLIPKVKNKNLAIVITFGLVIAFWSSLIYFGGSIIYQQIKELINYFSLNYETAKENINNIVKFGNGHLKFLADFNIQGRVIAFIQEILEKFSNYNFMGAFSSLTNLGTIMVLIPFVLFYFLKDDKKIHDSIVSLFPEEKQDALKIILGEIDQILAAYISSQLIVAFILGIFMLIGYLVIGLPNSLALALIAMITSLIPVLGPTLGIVPALFIALTTNLITVMKLFLVLIIAQYLEGNLVRPLVQGEKLNIHPLIVLFIIVTSILLFGILGALFAVPAYTVARIIIKNLIKFKKGELEI
jgi:predicted PurR-regulated permease PerM